MELSPLKFKPVLLSKPWGGHALWKILGKGGADDIKMGESWELSDRPEAATKVVDGRLDGVNLPGLIERFGGDLLGAEFAGGFPLLYKFICAREKLSVQVHPGSDSVFGEAKTECWYVVDAEPGAKLIVGLASDGRSREETLALLKSSRCEEVLRRWPANKGDVFFIPAGTVHAITEGLLLYEVQQNSDTTFRLYDWGRLDSEGKSRPLHLEQASAVADLESRVGYKIQSLSMNRDSHTEDYLVACPYFALVKWHDFLGSSRLETQGKFQVISVISGSFHLSWGNGEIMPLDLGDTLLIPASLESVQLEVRSQNSELIVSWVPDLEGDIRELLKKAGFNESEVLALSGPPGIRSS